MAAIQATYSFTPGITGGGISVVGNSESEIKAAVLAQIGARLAAETATIAALTQAQTEMSA